MDNSGFLPLVRRWWWLLALAAACAGLTAYVAASRTPPTYEAVVRVLTGPVNTDFGTLRASGELARTYSELATSGPVLNATLDEVDSSLTADELRASVTAAANEVTRIVTIRVRNTDADLARRLAGGIADSLREISRRDREPQFALIDDLLEQDELAELPAPQRDAIRAAAQRVFQEPEEGRLSIVDPARAILDPVAPRVSLITLLAAIGGLLGASILIMVKEQSRDAIDAELALTDGVATPILGSVGGRRSGRERVHIEGDESPDADAFRLLGAKLTATLDGETPLRTIVVAGTDPAERSGSVAANLATALAEGNSRRVLLVDANTLTRDVTRLFGLADAPGYADVLMDESFSKNGRVKLPVQLVGATSVLPHGGGTAPPLLDVERADRLLKRFANDADIVIVDAPPVTRSPSTLTLARAADATLVVVERGKTKRDALAQTLRSLSLVGANVAGTVVREPQTLRQRLPLLS